MLPKRTLNVALLVVVIAGAGAFGLARYGTVAGQDAASPTAEQDAQTKIENAMSAAPSMLAEQATILDNAADANGKLVVLREGTNGWYCLPDAYGTPGPDPMCFDQTWLDWIYALLGGTEPNVTVPGLAYMLQGGSDASNTDPFATEPAAGDEWIASPPHVMVLLPGKLDQTGFSTEANWGGPWIMWAGTPYEHIMMPVADAEHDM